MKNLYIGIDVSKEHSSAQGLDEKCKDYAKVMAAVEFFEGKDKILIENCFTT